MIVSESSHEDFSSTCPQRLWGGLKICTPPHLGDKNAKLGCTLEQLDVMNRGDI